MTAAMRPPELKPCPFCGGKEPLLDEHPAHTHTLARWMPDHPGSWTVECLKCSTGFVRPTREEATAAWNRRAPAVVIDEGDEVLMEVVAREWCAIEHGFGDAPGVIKNTVDVLWPDYKARARCIIAAIKEHANG